MSQNNDRTEYQVTLGTLNAGVTATFSSAADGWSDQGAIAIAEAVAATAPEGTTIAIHRRVIKQTDTDLDMTANPPAWI